MCERERERERVCVCVSEREREAGRQSRDPAGRGQQTGAGGRKEAENPPTGVPHVQEHATPEAPTVGLCLGSWGGPRGVRVLLWARYPCSAEYACAQCQARRSA